MDICLKNIGNSRKGWRNSTGIKVFALNEDNLGSFPITTYDIQAPPVVIAEYRARNKVCALSGIIQNSFPTKKKKKLIGKDL